MIELAAEVYALPKATPVPVVLKAIDDNPSLLKASKKIPGDRKWRLIHHKAVKADERTRSTLKRYLSPEEYEAYKLQQAFLIKNDQTEARALHTEEHSLEARKRRALIKKEKKSGQRPELDLDLAMRQVAVGASVKDKMPVSPFDDNAQRLARWKSMALARATKTTPDELHPSGSGSGPADPALLSTSTSTRSTPIASSNAHLSLPSAEVAPLQQPISKTIRLFGVNLQA